MLIKTDVKRARHVRLKSVASVKRNERDQHRPTRATSHKILSFVRSVVAFQSQAKDEKAQHTNNNNNDNYNDNDNGNDNDSDSNNDNDNDDDNDNDNDNDYNNSNKTELY